MDYDELDQALVLSSVPFMLRIHAAAADLLRLDAAHQARWAERESLQVGTTALGRAFWCAGEAAGSVRVLVGHDDETWDLALTLPDTVVADIIRLASQSSASE